MRHNQRKLFLGIIILGVLGIFLYSLSRRSKTNNDIMQQIQPTIGYIESLVSTTGTVLPKNRLAVKPPVSGRVEMVLVKEGQKVKEGETLAWMSSTERAALLDAARGEGEEALKYWTEIYKAIPLISPIEGEVIVSTTQPGQTVTVNDAVIVLSDELIVRAQVDETDIGKIKLGQKAVISLDAYADKKIKATTEHIYYESETINNVTVYKVDLIAEDVPDFFRSGMNASIDLIENSKEEALLIPLEAVSYEKNSAYVFVVGDEPKDVVSRAIIVGMTDNKNAEILSGLSLEDVVVMKKDAYVLPKNQDTGKNPFMPDRRRGTKK